MVVPDYSFHVHLPIDWGSWLSIHLDTFFWEMFTLVLYSFLSGCFVLFGLTLRPVPCYLNTRILKYILRPISFDPKTLLQIILTLWVLFLSVWIFCFNFHSIFAEFGLESCWIYRATGETDILTNIKSSNLWVQDISLCEYRGSHCFISFFRKV